MIALAPMSFADMRREWAADIHAYDASLHGFGVVSAPADVHDIGEVGRVRERFRFAGGGHHKPREGSDQRVLECSLDAEVAGLSEHDALQTGSAASFSEVPAKLVEERTWTTVYGGRWRKRHQT